MHQAFRLLDVPVSGSTNQQQQQSSVCE